MAQILKGKPVADQIQAEVEQKVSALAAKGLVPHLAVLLVGSDPASEVYMNRKKKTGEKLGFQVSTHILPGESTTEEVLSLLSRLNSDPGVHGILVEQPLPAQVDKEKVGSSISPDKDVDGANPVNLGRLVGGDESHVPATAQAVIEMLERSGVSLKGKQAVVVGRSTIVGKPAALLLLNRHATVTICHSRTADLGAVARCGEILVAAVGKAGLITGDMVGEGAVVIDVGTNVVGDKLVGDVDFDSVEPKASAITPVPGGVGPLTNILVLRNVADSCQRMAARG
ncbi:MAG: bifunctional 5,10-methylenetetrahydrofolate dehydrogenase/5,10-methenyltetrahydrofolate cyclohydrolase [Bacillota bacterium]|nr:bifunctional 5,10-methylenetetrahydrofolate dehydrogenase/5,10-methenyltetrahydrofolate cyclohydrolase [Bacillota bacterium]